jgi:hypothetical protein
MLMVRLTSSIDQPCLLPAAVYPRFRAKWRFQLQSVDKMCWGWKFFEEFLSVWANAGWTEKLEPNPIMKTQMSLRTGAATLILIASITAVLAQPTPSSAPIVNPATGLPAPGGIPAPTIDPTTGLPLATPEPQWIDANWNDPDIVLTNLIYDSLPLSEVARDLRERFKDYFDILPMPRTFDHDWGNEIPIQLQLKNVKASEVFNAMNLVFENDRTPLRWELKNNVHSRPLAILRVLPEAAPPPPPAAAPPEVRRVFFVGDLVDDKKSAANEEQQILKIMETVNHVWQISNVQPTAGAGHLDLYQPAQLIIVNGTPDQVDLVQQTLEALKQKVERERAARHAVLPTTDEPKASSRAPK